MSRKRQSTRPTQATRRSRRGLAGALLAAALLPGVLAPGAASAATAEATTGTTTAGSAARSGSVLTLQGRGYGHGKGLSQWGAEGAARQGVGWKRIVRFYYPHTRIGKVGGSIRVLVTADTDRDTRVVATSGLVVKSLGSGAVVDVAAKHPRAVQWRLRPASKKRTLVQYKLAGKRWTSLRTVPGEAQFQADGPLTLVTPSGRTSYRGALRSSAAVTGGRDRHTVNVLPLEQYLRGVVPLEAYPSWHAAALRSQAVAARTYAAFERAEYRSRYYQICDTTSCQVYGGADAEYGTTDAAIRATRKAAMTRSGKPIFAQFSASDGGWTQGSSLAYQIDQRDPWDRWSGNPYRSWTVSFTAAQLRAAFPGVGAFRRVKVLARDGNGAWGGRVTSIRVVGAQGSVTVTGDAFRSALGMYSTWFRKA
ncbi:SpoIID/LytB domain-containing protein [Nocardioides sp. GY 10127]|uniref:SpoIID/LytB domain-containing protein n=1 Tax=Nocardioides sp. GY 10127 TaxID=2569762 RepID=UPI0010A829BE|nr:SpoIID/LytB domain-containing protein [Nocardioides sp. GY 10127]TIC84267.1 SpoIID/LytB domain-containing protein [Nocardioides sp. GY 10127]